MSEQSVTFSVVDGVPTMALNRPDKLNALTAAMFRQMDAHLTALPADDEEAITLLTRAKGIGRWSAEIYLLFAEGRADIWPAGDLAVQIDVGQVMGWAERPSEKQVRAVADAWRPHRGAVAIFAWHHYKTGVV